MNFPSTIAKGMCVPFSLSSDEAVRGSRLGGPLPKGVNPHFESVQQRYLGTLEFDNGCAISLFYSLDPLGVDSERDMLAHNNRVLYESDLIHAVVHDSGLAPSRERHPCEVSCHGLVIANLQEDSLDDDCHTVFPLSKCGGEPFADNVALVGNAFGNLRDSGFRQLLQFDTPNPQKQPEISGFPWDPGWLHVFVRGDLSPEGTFAFVFQQ